MSRKSAFQPCTGTPGDLDADPSGEGDPGTPRRRFPLAIPRRAPARMSDWEALLHAQISAMVDDIERLDSYIEKVNELLEGLMAGLKKRVGVEWVRARRSGRLEPVVYRTGLTRSAAARTGKAPPQGPARVARRFWVQEVPVAGLARYAASLSEARDKPAMLKAQRQALRCLEQLVKLRQRAVSVLCQGAQAEVVWSTHVRKGVREESATGAYAVARNVREVVDAHWLLAHEIRVYVTLKLREGQEAVEQNSPQGPRRRS